MNGLSVKVFLFLFLLPPFLFPQAEQQFIDSAFSQNFLQTSLDNDANVAKLDSRINLNYEFEKFTFSLRNLYVSNVSKLDRNFFRDYDHLRFITRYKFSSKFESGIGIETKILSDDKNVETNKNNNNFIFSNFIYMLKENFVLDAKLGLRNEDQIGEISNGPSGIFEATAVDFKFSNYITNGKITLFYEDISAKKNNNYELETNIYKRFSGESDNIGFLRVYNRRNDFFFPASESVKNIYGVKNNIEKRTEEYFYAGDFFNYNVNGNVFVTLGGNFLNKVIRREFKYKPASSNIIFENVYDTKIIENNLEFVSKLDIVWKKVLASAKLSYTERSENHTVINTEGINPLQLIELEKAESNKDNNSRKSGVAANAIYFLSNSNWFTVQSSASILYYDTDSRLNFDDRDEMEFISSLAYTYDNLTNFRVRTEFEYNLSKLHYLFSERSANNYSNRIYKLSSTSYFSPVKNLSTKNTVQVLANYTVFDYEDLVSQVQSFIYRQVSIRDTTNYFFTNDFALNFFSEVKMYEQGQYNDAEFSVRPVNFFIDQFYFAELAYYFNDFIKLSGGYKFFEQKRFEYESGERNLRSRFKTYGLLAKLALYFSSTSSINLIGGVDYLRYDNPSLNNDAGILQINVYWNI